MEIIVKGKGTEYFTPDETILSIHFETKGQSYEEALREGVKSVESFVNEILLTNGFQKEEMKTRSFVVKEDKRYNEVTRSYESNGYSFSQEAGIKFDYDKEKIAHIMESLSKLKNSPSCQIDFSVKDEKECQRKVLAEAYKDAEEQAQAIALASGKALRQCMKIDFKPFTTDYISESNFDANVLFAEENSIGASQAIMNTFTPEDIEVSETLYCLWIAD